MAQPLFGPGKPLSSPLYMASVYDVGDADTCDAVLGNETPGFAYARDAHPNATHLAGHLATLEGAAWAHITSSGMAALSAVMLSLVRPGQQVLLSNRLYGKSTVLVRQELKRFGVESAVIDACDLDQVANALAAGPRLFLVETLSNPMLRLVDVDKIGKMCRAQRCKLFVDNTFATPILLKPLAHGADLVMESLTKMIGGHSDVTLGLVAGHDPDLAMTLGKVITTWGFTADPFPCWLTERSLYTLDLRMRTATANAAEVADFLAKQQGIVQVVYPGRPDHPDHGLACTLLPQGAGNMLAFEVPGDRAAVNRFLQAGPIPLCPSLGHATTTFSHPASSSHRADSPAGRAAQGITEGLLRLSVGIEPVDTILDQLSRHLQAI